MRMRLFQTLVIALHLVATGIATHGQVPRNTKGKPPTPTERELRKAAEADWRACNNYAAHLLSKKDKDEALQYLLKGEKSFLDRYDKDGNKALSKEEHLEIPGKVRKHYPLLFFNLGAMLRNKGKDYRRGALRRLKIAALSNDPSSARDRARNDYGVLLKELLEEEGKVEGSEDFEPFDIAFDDRKSPPPGAKKPHPAEKPLELASKSTDATIAARAFYNLGILTWGSNPGEAQKLIDKARRKNPNGVFPRPEFSPGDRLYNAAVDALAKGHMEDAIYNLNQAWTDYKSLDAFLASIVLARELAEKGPVMILQREHSQLVKQSIRIKTLLKGFGPKIENLYLAYFWVKTSEHAKDPPLIELFAEYAISYIKQLKSSNKPAIDSGTAKMLQGKPEWKDHEKVHKWIEAWDEGGQRNHPTQPATTNVHSSNVYPDPKPDQELIAEIGRKKFDVGQQEIAKGMNCILWDFKETHYDNAIRLGLEAEGLYYKGMLPKDCKNQKTGITATELKEAEEWLIKSAKLGYPRAKWALAVKYLPTPERRHFKELLWDSARELPYNSSEWIAANAYHLIPSVLEEKKPFHERKDKEDLEKHISGILKKHPTTGWEFLRENLQKVRKKLGRVEGRP